MNSTKKHSIILLENDRFRWCLVQGCWAVPLHRAWSTIPESSKRQVGRDLATAVIIMLAVGLVAILPSVVIWSESLSDRVDQAKLVTHSDVMRASGDQLWNRTWGGFFDDCGNAV